MSDYMIRGIAEDGAIRFFAATTKDTVEQARACHHLSPVATAALGRLLTGGVMMGAMMKNDSDVLTIKIDCQGPIQGLTVTADKNGSVKGFVLNPLVDLPSAVPGKLNVGGALDLGVLSVIRDTGLKEPYIGQTILQTGEIGDDLTYYFASSEQVPSSVGLGVLLTHDGNVSEAGGFIIQVLPNASEEALTALEERLKNFTSVTEHLNAKETPEEIMESLFGGIPMEITETLPVAFRCNCSRGKTAAMLRTLTREELVPMIDDGLGAEMVCQFCNTKYKFEPEELKKFLKKEPKKDPKS